MSEELFQQAAQLFKSGQKAEAETLLKKYLRQTPQDARAWWALANVTADSTIKRKSLERVLKLQPGHPKAQQLLDEMDSYIAELDEEEPELYYPEMSKLGYSPDEEEDDEAEQDSTGYSFQPTNLYPVDDDKEGEHPYTSSSFLTKEKKEEIDWDTATSSKTKAKSSEGGQAELAIGCGLILVSVVAVIGLGAYAYFYLHMGIFGLFGPDLTETASANSYEIRYPDGWSTTTIDETDELLLSSFNIDLMALYNGSAEADPALEEELSSKKPEDFFYIEIAPLDATEFAGEGMTPQQSINFLVEIMELAAKQADVDFETNQDDVPMGDEEGTFTAIHMGMQQNQSVVEDLFEIGESISSGGLFGQQDMFMSFYFVTTKHNGTDYLFLCLTFEKNHGDNEQLVKRMLNSFAFTD